MVKIQSDDLISDELMSDDQINNKKGFCLSEWWDE